jgi:hypothetical protein
MRIEKGNPQKPLVKVKRTREEMEITLKMRKKVATDSPRSALKRKNILEEGKASSSRVKREHESTNLKAQKMMKGTTEPFAMPTMVRVVPTMVQATI